MGSGNEFAKKSWVSGINCDAKHEGRFPGKDAKEDARISAATVATNVPDAVSSKGASTSQHLAGSPSVALSCSPSKEPVLSASNKAGMDHWRKEAETNDSDVRS